MAVSKRTRFEVLRRDNHTCRYCGGSAPDVRLTVDHVIPVTLGGSDDPTNLVVACRDCNAGKSSIAPDAEFVAQVSDDAARWAAAMEAVAAASAVKREVERATLAHFQDEVWGAWTYGGGKKFPMPDDWEDGILRQLASGLTMDDLAYAVETTMKKTWVSDEFRYFMGVCKTMVAERHAAAQALIEGECNG